MRGRATVRDSSVFAGWFGAGVREGGRVTLQHGVTISTDKIRASVRSNEKDHHEREDEPMKLTTITNVSLDGVMQGLGGPDEDRRGGFERGGWAPPLFDSEATTFLSGVYQRADAFLFGRRTYEIFA